MRQEKGGSQVTVLINASPWANASLSQEVRGSCFQEVDSEADR